MPRLHYLRRSQPGAERAAYTVVARLLKAAGLVVGPLRHPHPGARLRYDFTVATRLPTCVRLRVELKSSNPRRRQGFGGVGLFGFAAHGDGREGFWNTARNATGGNPVESAHILLFAIRDIDRLGRARSSWEESWMGWVVPLSPPLRGVPPRGSPVRAHLDRPSLEGNRARLQEVFGERPYGPGGDIFVGSDPRPAEDLPGRFVTWAQDVRAAVAARRAAE